MEEQKPPLTPEVSTSATGMTEQLPMRQPQISNMHELRAKLQKRQEEIEIVKEITRTMMREGVHFGVPGLDPNDEDYEKKKGKRKSILYRKGAQVIYNFFNCYPKPALERDGELSFPHRGYTAKVLMTNKETEETKGEGHGYCSTYEPQYRYREESPTCPECGKNATIRKDNKKNQWYCWQRLDGCGKTFAWNDSRIKTGGKIENSDLPELHNTVMQMAIKRGEVQATIVTWGLGDLFEEPPPGLEEGEERQRQHQPTQPVAESATFTKTPAPKVITEGQRNRLFAIGKSKGVSSDEIRGYVHEVWKIDSCNNIPIGTKYYDAIITQVENGTVSEWLKSRGEGN